MRRPLGCGHVETGSAHFRCLFALKVRSDGDIFAPIFVIFLVVVRSAAENGGK